MIDRLSVGRISEAADRFGGDRPWDRRGPFDRGFSRVRKAPAESPAKHPPAPPQGALSALRGGGIFSENYACIDCGISIPEIEPRNFSFNSPYGACPTCNGLGTRMETTKSFWSRIRVSRGSTRSLRRKKGDVGYLMYYRAVMRELAARRRIDAYGPFARVTKKFPGHYFYGSTDEIWGKPYEGVVRYLERMFRETDSDWLKDEISRYMSVLPCPACKGARLKNESLAVKIHGQSIAEATALSIPQAKAFFLL